MRVIVTGSRAWPDMRPVWHSLSSVLVEHDTFTLVHGDCSTGADFFAHQWAQAHPEVEEIRYPASWEAYGRAAGPMRNRKMIEDGADLVLAFPLPSGSGTHHTVWLARQAGIPVKVWEWQ